MTSPKFHSLLIILLILPMISHGQGLSEQERDALLKRIQAIQEQAKSNVDQKYRAAMSAFSSAMDNSNEAFSLYMKCEEMVNFEKKNKKPSDFREWRLKNEERLGDPAFRLALQYQLRWAVLSLKATAKDADREQLALEASGIVDAIVQDAEKLAAHKGVLTQGALSSVFAQCYNINGIEVKNWPPAPGQFDVIYDTLILPPLRRPDRVTHLSNFWQKRIAQQGEIVTAWNSSDKTKSGGAPSGEYEKFVSETVPQLRWDAEVDIFKAGDQRGSATRMLKHIEANINHKAAPKWIQTFATMLEQKDAPATAPAGETPPATETTPPAETPQNP